jgi:F-type H+-transporting ATPase subunit gamma
MANLQTIKTRIRSVKNTRKITRAMEMIAATKMRRSIDAVLRTRTYANLSWETLLNIAESVQAHTDENLHHPLLEQPNPATHAPKTFVILITSNRGLCGGFNTAIMKKAHDSIITHEKEEGREVEFIIIGEKGKEMCTHFGYHIHAAFPKADAAYSLDETRVVSDLVTESFLKGECDKVLVAYTDFVNAGSQVPRVKQLLPVDICASDEYLGIAGRGGKLETKRAFIEEKRRRHCTQVGEISGSVTAYVYEPSPDAVLHDLIPRLIEIQLFQALLESNASEHSARMNAMNQATEAAGDMVDDLTLYYNKARQAAITAELGEIVAGANALSE